MGYSINYNKGSSSIKDENQWKKEERNENKLDVLLDDYVEQLILLNSHQVIFDWYLKTTMLNKWNVVVC